MYYDTGAIPKLLYDCFTLKLAKPITNTLKSCKFKFNCYANTLICTTPQRGCTNFTGLNLSVKKSHIAAAVKS